MILRVFLNVEPQNIECPMSKELSVPSTFDIPCSIFDIQNSSTIKANHCRYFNSPSRQMRIFELSKMRDNPEVWCKQYLKK